VRVGDPIERRLGLEGVFTIPGFGDVGLGGGLDWEPGAGLVHLMAATGRQSGGGAPASR
jgi:hypothetical protein